MLKTILGFIAFLLLLLAVGIVTIIVVLLHAAEEQTCTIEVGNSCVVRQN